MHSKIYQVTREPLTREDYIYTGCYDTYQVYEFCDYMGDLTEYEEQEAMKNLDTILEGVFSREGRTLTYVGAEKFVIEWVENIKLAAESLTANSMKQWYPLYRMKEILNRTHLRYHTLFVFGPSGDALPETFGDFMQEVYEYLKPGDKLYIGGILDFHF